ncbi:MAG TPA: hypothetical protein H9979_05150 [Candidatus Megamonas gallistercoris]|nr:hypothetical protein [Candidatus Megamonas gallistercoris]
MNIFIQVKQIGKRRDIVKKQPFQLKYAPDTVHELLNEIVADLVAKFNERTKNSFDENILKYLSSQDIDNMAVAGKISFNLNYNDTKADLDKAQKNVALSFQDGLFRIFLNENELTDLNQTISLKENDTLIFIRLVMLAGRMW